MRTSAKGFQPLGHIVLISREPPEDMVGMIALPEIMQFQGLIADVKAVGDEVDGSISEGMKVIMRTMFTYNTFTEPDMFLTTDTTLVAYLEGEDPDEDIVPMNDYIMIDPDIAASEIDGVIVEGSTLMAKTTGVVRCCGPLAGGNLNGKRVVYEAAIAIRVEERGHEYHLTNRIWGVIPQDKEQTNMENIQPIGDAYLVRMEEPEKFIADIQLAERYQKRNPRGIVLCCGHATSNPDIKEGTVILVKQVNDGIANAGFAVDPRDPDLRIVQRSDILGVFS